MSPPSLPVREVHLSSERTYGFGDYQLNYLDYRTRRLIPSTRILQDGALLYRTNALGCHGDELVPDAPVIGVFGDSCVHGYLDDAFADHIAVPGCQPLNAGVEGLTLPWIVDRFLELRDRAPMICAAVHSGWHNIAYNQRDEAFWAAQLDRVDGPPLIAHFRLVADINDEAVAQGYGAALATVPGYQAWTGFDYQSQAGRRAFADEIARFNRFIEGYCADRGRLLIDLEPATAPRTYGDLGRSFLDFIHPSPAAYPAMARVIEGTLSGPISQTLSGAAR